jgi:hypothetical protein
MWSVYMIRCGDNSLYTGISNVDWVRHSWEKRKMGRAAKLREARRNIQQNRVSTFNYQRLEASLDSVKLRDWLVNQWLGMINIYLFKNQDELRDLANTLTKRLYQMLVESLNQDAMVEYKNYPPLLIAVGVNVNTWTVWTSVCDLSTGFEIHTQDQEDYSLELKTRKT